MVSRYLFKSFSLHPQSSYNPGFWSQSLACLFILPCAQPTLFLPPRTSFMSTPACQSPFHLSKSHISPMSSIKFPEILLQTTFLYTPIECHLFYCGIYHAWLLINYQIKPVAETLFSLHAHLCAHMHALFGRCDRQLSRCPSDLLEFTLLCNSILLYLSQIQWLTCKNIEHGRNDEIPPPGLGYKKTDVHFGCSLAPLF